MDIKITSEAEAFEYLEQAIRGEMDTGELISFNFENWPSISLRLEGDGYNSVITPEMAQGIISLQTAVNRIYARLVHHEANTRSLKTVEKEQLRIKAKVEDGSTLIEIPMGDFAETLATNLVSKMDSNQLVITILGIVAVAAGSWCHKNYLNNRAKEKEIDEDTQKAIAMTTEETKRMGVFAEAISKVHELAHIRDDLDLARTDLFKGIADAKQITLDGVTVAAAPIKKLTSNVRTQSKEIQLNGTYLIRGVDLSAEDEVKLKLSNVDNGREFTARFHDQSLDRAQVTILQNAEWGRSRVYLSINATELRGDITSATVVSVQLQPEQSL
ncbi:hypothetical protein [uncultured Deefgea sp.]|uniref:hypothetical protein n=1 Tax=uncultured Deefgea sp. TaxID=1304914 RepID=UPI0025914E32|nr:hypothetical protein [uncultured Deefgea sp.]